MSGMSYLDFVKLRARANPCISGLAEHLQRESLTESRIVYLDYPQNGTSNPQSGPLSAAEGDLNHLVNGISPFTTRLLFVENITSEMVTMLGESLDIDPLFFADYLHTRFEDISKAVPPPSLASLPSLIAASSHIHLHYHQAVALDSNDGHLTAPYALKTCSNAPRNVRRLAPISGRDIAIARACCSFIIKSVGTSQICLFLVDAPISSVEALDTKTNKSYQATVLHGGFEDFDSPLSFSSFAQGKAKESFHKSSMLNSILHYFQKSLPPGFHVNTPRLLSVGYYPIRIVLAEWNFYTHLTSRCLKYYEFSIRSKTGRLRDEDIVDLQRWRRRSKRSQQRLDILAEVINSHLQDEDEREPWELILKDTDWLRGQLHDYCQSLEQMVTVATLIVQLLDSRRSILETVNMRRLTYIALFFMPLGWVANLFSMSDGYSPGHKHFWVYFATALPLLGIVLVLSALPYDHIFQTLRRFWDGIWRVKEVGKVSQVSLSAV